MKRGFTLIELLVVIAIIGTLSAIVLSSLNSARAKGNDAARVAQVRQINTAYQLYLDDNKNIFPWPNGPTGAACLGLITGQPCWGGALGGSTSLASKFQPYIAMPSDPVPSRGIGDRYVYIYGIITPNCLPPILPPFSSIRPYLVYMPEAGPPANAAACPVGVMACCSIIFNCGITVNTNFCAVPLD